MATPEEKVQQKKAVQPQPQWAWLPQDRCENVHIVVMQDPDVIFLRLNHFTDCLEKLVKDIQKYASTRKKDYDCKKLLEVGDVCLGKPAGCDEWNRAVVKSRPGEDTVEVFYVDYGDTDIIPWTSVMPISNQLITKLPFQVIECYLAGVRFLSPPSETKEWEDEVIDTIYDLSRNEKEEATSLMAKVCSAEAKGKYTNGKRYKVVLADCNVNPMIIINSKLVSSAFAELFEEDELLKGFEIPYAENGNFNSSECEEEIPSSSDVEVVPVTKKSNLALSRRCDLGKELAIVENDNKVEQFLKELDEGDFDCSIFHGIENDADISDNTSEGSGLSLPCPGGSLPLTSRPHPHLQLPPPEAEDSVSCSSSSVTVSSSHNSSILSFNQEKSCVKENFESNNFKISQAHGTPFTNSSPKSNTIFGEQLTPETSAINQKDLSVCSGNKLKITGIANNFKDLISPSFLRSSFPTPSSEDTGCDDLDDYILENTMVEINPDLNYILDESDKKDTCQLTTVRSDVKENIKEKISPCQNWRENVKDTHQLTEIESTEENKSPCQKRVEHVKDTHQLVGPDVEESAEEKKSPCLKWVEHVTPDSDEDLSFITENSVTNKQRAENGNVEPRTPLVEWHQDDNFVYLHIKLPALSNFEFNSDFTSVHFRAVYGEVHYEVNLPELFGGHKPDKAVAAAKTCYFEIRLEKLIKGKRAKWPRLTKNYNKLHWLKLNAEKACDGLVDSDDEDVKRLACSLPLWNENPTDSVSVASSDRTELTCSELSL